VKFSVSVDEKGRIIIPAEIRKSLGFSGRVEIFLFLSEAKIEIRRL
jgi:AbrB family looped-hinge helix DNA binding protein